GAFQRTLGELVDELTAPAGKGKGKRAKPKDQPISLLMMDLDAFKGYNDRLGHPAGDALLHAVGTAIYGAARSDDRVFRYGGDEFALVLPAVDAEAAASIGDRVRQAVARLTANDTHPVTISVGAATLPGDAADKNGLIGAADTALYYGKQSGGDRVVPASDVPSEMRDLRGTLDQLARAALLHPVDAPVSSLAGRATLIAGSIGSHGESEVIDSLLSLARSIDARDPAVRGHADRVGNLAVRIASELTCPAQQTAEIGLAARLHGLDIMGASELEPIQSLRPAALIVRQVRSATGPDEAGIGSQIVSVADLYDTLMATPAGKRRGRTAALAELRAQVGKRYRSEVVEALATVVAARRDRGQRRRRVDHPASERGAA
ncbi:MAG: diguanylate cyclase domain-containing protein, partial [Candidatus Limnocylindria bacterium]